MTNHQIDGNSILRDCKSRYESYLPDLQSNLSTKKVTIVQFEPSPSDLVEPYQLGKHRAADISTKQKVKLFRDFLGCEVEVIKWRYDATFEYCQNELERLNAEAKAIVIQHPIPPKLNRDGDISNQLVQLITPDNDLDAMSEAGLEYWGYCATADAINRVLDAAISSDDEYIINVIGYKGFVGRGVVAYLDSKFNVTIEGIDLENLNEIDTLKNQNPRAIVSATGRANLLDENHLSSDNFLVVDCTFVPTIDLSGKLIIESDVSKSVYGIPQFITPVPGGIGPIEMAVLLERFMQKEFPELRLKPWKLKSLDELSVKDLAAKNYLTEDSLKQEVSNVEENVLTENTINVSSVDKLDPQIVDKIQELEIISGFESCYFEKDWYLVRALESLAKIEDPQYKLVLTGDTALIKGAGEIDRFCESISFKVQESPTVTELSSSREFRIKIADSIAQLSSNLVLTERDKLIELDQPERAVAKIEYRAQFPLAPGFSNTIQLELDFCPPALELEPYQISSRLNQYVSSAPEITRMSCTSTIETAADKLMFLSAQIVNQEPDRPEYDPRTIRHFYDLTTLAPKLIDNPQWAALSYQTIDRSLGKAGELNEDNPRQLLTGLMEKLSGNRLYAEHYEDFVQSVTYGASKSFVDALDSLNSLSAKVIEQEADHGIAIVQSNYPNLDLDVDLELGA